MSHAIIQDAQRIVGDAHVITEPAKMAKYCKGFRFGIGTALAVIKPGTLVEMWQIAQACVKHDIIIITQAANTGLTGGSTPFGDYDRDVVVLSTVRLKGIRLINDASQAVALPGASLFELEDILEAHDREPHSVIGSSCIGASIIGGICNNSGGALIRRGPAYTEMAAYAQLDADGQLRFHNNLGINLGDDPEPCSPACKIMTTRKMTSSSCKSSPLTMNTTTAYAKLTPTPPRALTTTAAAFLKHPARLAA